MRYLCLLTAILLLPVSAGAQQDQRRGSGDHRSGQRNSGAEQRQANPNTTGLSPLGLPPAQQRPVPWWEQRQVPWWEKQNAAAKAGVAPWQYTPTMLEQQQQRGHNNRGNGNYYRPNSGYIYVVPSYGYFPYTLPGTTEAYVTPPAPTEVIAPRPIEPPPLPEPPPPIGVLRLEVEPRNLIQIYIDGVYVGTPADVGDELGLSPGVRHIELRAPGFASKSFDADIVLDRSITYRAQLERDPSAPPPPAPIVTKPGSRTMYVIPGCYMGNVAPTQANLRPGCDMSKLTTIEP